MTHYIDFTHHWWNENFNPVDFDVEFDENEGYDEFESSWITGVLYNANDRKAWVAVNEDRYYAYDNVSLSDVQNLVSANSVGAAYNQIFKVEHGPSVEDFDFWGAYETKVDVRPGTGLVQNDWNSEPVPNLLVETPADGRVARLASDSPERPAFESDGANALDTAEHSLSPIPAPVVVMNVDPADVVSIPKGDEPTNEHSLMLIETEVEDEVNNNPTFVVHFKVNGKKGNYVADGVSDWQSAVAVVRNVFAAAGVSVKIRKVVVKF